VVVFQAPDGSYRFPGDPNGRSAHEYSKQGYHRVECHNVMEVRQLERKVNQREQSALHRAFERQQERSESSRSARRGQLRQEMQHFSTKGRDLARAIMERNDRKDAARRPGEAGFRVEVLSQNESNLD
jgi:hypothetical protein